MKPYCRILISYNSSSIVSNFNNLSKSQTKQFNSRRFRSCGSQITGYIGVIESNRRCFIVSGSNWDQSRVFFNHVDKIWSSGRGRGSLVISHVASDLRNLSTTTSVDSTTNVVNEKGFERIYIQGGLNLKPLVIEKVEEGHGLAQEEESSRVGLDGTGINIEDDSKALGERKVSEIEEEAWRLLRNAVVSYCGNPVGTVAANDPVDKQPLNYDQVFIRDFVPSALAFLLNGEEEIVKNFLLHTLQLQVIFFFFYDLNCFVYLFTCTL